MSPPLDGDVYAQPLVLGATVLVATEGNSIYALDASSGTPRWRVNLGPPVRAAALPCGNIDPVGITSTPVIDPGSNTVFVVGFLSPLHHELVAIDVTSGTIRWRQRVDPPGADPAVQSQRGALALLAGRVYVAFGGRYGDCGDYRGRVASVPESGGPEQSFAVAATGAGIWSPGGVVTDSGSILVATGNGDAGGRFAQTESVLRLSPALTVLDTFAPSNWSALDRSDTDIGSISPALLPGGLVFQSGKAGVGYLLAASHFGGVGGARFTAPVCPAGAYGAPAVADATVLVPCRDGLVALHIDPTTPSFGVAWRAGGINAGTPIVTGSIAWSVDIDSGSLLAFDLATGRQLLRRHVGAVAHFASPAAGDGQLVVAAGQAIHAFGG